MSHTHMSGLPHPPLVLRARNRLLSGLLFVVVLQLALVVLPPLVDSYDTAIRSDLDRAQTFAGALIDTENSLQQMQADTRGYIITQEPAFLEQYRASEAGLSAQLDELVAHGVRMDSALQAQLTELQGAIQRWQSEGSARQMALAEQGRLSDAAAEITVGESQGRFDALRGRIGDLEVRAQARRSLLLAELSWVRTIQTLTTLVLGMLGLMALGFIIAGFWRMLSLMRDLTQERSRAAGLAQQLSAQLAMAERQNQQLTVFHAVASASVVSMQPARRTRYVLATIARALNLPYGGAWIVPLPAGDALQREAGPRSGAASDHAAILQVVKQGKPVLLTHTGRLDGDPELALLIADLGADVHSAVILPLQGRAQLIGALVLSTDRPGHFQADDLSFYSSLAAEVGMVIDNTQLYAAAQTERRRLQAVFDHSPEGIMVAETPDNRVVLINPTARALIGDLPPLATLHDHPLSGRVYRPGGEQVPNDELPLLATLRDGAPRRGGELIIAAPDGARVPVMITTVPLHNEEGELSGAVAVFQDLRQLREVERLKSDFVALVSHELRTPLTAIKGSVDTLVRGSVEPTPARVREFLQIISEQSDRLQELIDNLLSLSQVEAGALRLRRTLIALPPLVQGVVRQVREREELVRIQTDVATSMPLVSADAHRIEQVLFNLLDNAIKFSPPQGTITVRAGLLGNAVSLRVRDQGPGIPPAERDRIFERFYQVAHPANAQPAGSGLGLAICKALIEAHGGQIGVDDAPGGGAEFWFTLPAAPEGEPQVKQIRASSHTAQRVLAIDDDPALRRILDRGLSDAGYSVQTVVEAQAALDAITQAPPDIVLLDLMLPGIDGFELCQQLREWTKVPIVMLTARAAEQDIVRGLQLGADDYITKPFHMSELQARIEAVLRRSQASTPVGGITLIQVGRLSVDLAQRRVIMDGREITLTPTEYGILTYMAGRVGQVLTHEQILKAVWGEGYGAESNYLWVHIAHLRQKIEDDPKQPRYIVTERGVGYRLVQPA